MIAARTRRGITLPEMLTAATLLVLTFCVVAQVLMPTAWLASVGQSRSDVQQGALVFIHTARKGLLNAAPDTVTVCASPPALSFVTISDRDPYDPVSGAPRLSPYFTVLWFDPLQGKVLTRTWPPDPPFLNGYSFTDPSRPPVLSQDDLKTIIKTGPSRVLVDHVETLRIEDANGEPNEMAVAWPLRLIITCAARSSRPHAADQEMERQTLSTRVTPGTVRW